MIVTQSLLNKCLSYCSCQRGSFPISCSYQTQVHTSVRNSTLFLLIVKRGCCISHFLKEIKYDSIMNITFIC